MTNTLLLPKGGTSVAQAVVQYDVALPGIARKGQGPI